MRQYYTSVESNNGQFIGVVYDPSNNNAVYRTAPYRTPAQATLDVTEYLKTKQAPKSIVKPQTPKDISFHPAPQKTYKCCGR